MLGSYKLDSRVRETVRVTLQKEEGESSPPEVDTVGRRRRRTKPPRFFAITFSPPIVPLLCRNRGFQDDGRHRPPNRSLKTDFPIGDLCPEGFSIVPVRSIPP